MVKLYFVEFTFENSLSLCVFAVEAIEVPSIYDSLR